MDQKDFDVFLSYNSEDRATVERIAVALADHAAIRAWFDQWELVPGDAWQLGLEMGLSNAKSCAVFVGPSGEGPWQRKEVLAALDRQAKASIFRVIPVLLPGVPARPKLPLFLSGNRWVEFKSLEDPEALWLLECGIRGVSPGRGRRKADTVPRLLQADPKPYQIPHDLIRPGGAMDVDSRYYIKRKADRQVIEEIRKPRGLVTVKGPRQAGKTSLILQAYVRSRRESKQLRSVFIDFQSLHESDLNSLEAIWEAVTVQVHSQLGLKSGQHGIWDGDKNYDWNISNCLDRFVFAGDRTPLLLCLDEVDRVFASPVQSEFFASVRAFFNRGAFDPAWKNVRWLLSTSTEPGFFIKDLSQSPFNIGLRVLLNRFAREEIAELARRHGLDADRDMIDRIMDYVGGRPYLVHLLLYHMAVSPDSTERLFDPRSAGEGVFLTHLERFLRQFQKEPDLAQAMKEVIDGHGCEDIKMADRLEAAGLVQRAADQKIVCACSLYANYFKEKI